MTLTSLGVALEKQFKALAPNFDAGVHAHTRDVAAGMGEIQSQPELNGGRRRM
jgi:hypothetical protein